MKGMALKAQKERPPRRFRIGAARCRRSYRLETGAGSDTDILLPGPHLAC
jgi:hypothetical protein